MSAPAKKVFQAFPTTFYHKSGRHQIVKSPDQVPQGPEWRDSPWPQKPASGSEVDVNSMPADAAISHLKDQLAEAQDTVRGLRSEVEWNKRMYDRNFGDLKEQHEKALARIAELEATPAEAAEDARTAKKGKAKTE